MEQQLLKEEVEQKAGFVPETSRDFDDLNQLIQKVTDEYLSPTTLKRIWGYLQHEQVNTRRHTHDVLARYAGYADFRAFVEETSRRQAVQSMILASNKITPQDLSCASHGCPTDVSWWSIRVRDGSWFARPSTRNSLPTTLSRVT